jgi:hypothetical protein
VPGSKGEVLFILTCSVLGPLGCILRACVALPNSHQCPPPLVLLLLLPLPLLLLLLLLLLPLPLLLLLQLLCAGSEA